MQGYNAIVVFNENTDKILMCKRQQNPYKGLSNFAGGKIEIGENGLDADYKELEEETSITKNDITLTHLMDFTYHLGNCFLEGMSASSISRQMSAETKMNCTSHPQNTTFLMLRNMQAKLISVI